MSRDFEYILKEIPQYEVIGHEQADQLLMSFTANAAEEEEIKADAGECRGRKGGR